MTCFSPVPASLAEHTNLKTGKRSLSFGNGLKDFSSVNAGFVLVPCGKCNGCNKDYSRQWSQRIYAESKMHDHNSMVTLTYDDDHLPDNSSLFPRDVTLFFKRLRKRGLKFSYYYCGEYGDTTFRPHYHIAFFGQDFSLGADYSHESKTGHALYTHPLINSEWGKGNCIINDLNSSTAAYIAAYVNKKLRGNHTGLASSDFDLIESVLKDGKRPNRS